MEYAATYEMQSSNIVQASALRCDELPSKRYFIDDI